MQVMQDCELKAFIHREARSRSPIEVIQEDLCQEAWMVIACAPQDYSIEAYMELAEQAIFSGYWQERKHILLMRGPTGYACEDRETPKHRDPDDPDEDAKPCKPALG